MEHHDDEREPEMIEIRCTRENVRETVSDLFPDPTEAEQWQIDGCVTDAAEGFNNLQFPNRDGENVHITIVTQAKIDADFKAEWDHSYAEAASKVGPAPTPEEYDAALLVPDDESLPHMHDEYDDKPCLACVQEKAEWAALPFPEQVERMRKTGVGADSEKTLSDLQKVLDVTPEEDDAWRVLESQRATEGLEDHAARRAQIKTGGSGYYARTVDESLPTEQNTGEVYLEDERGDRHRLSDLRSRAINGDREARGMLRAALLSGSYAQAMRHQLLEVATLTPADYTARDKANKDIQTLGEQLGIDNANTAEVGTFTDGPEERYSYDGCGRGGKHPVFDERTRTTLAVAWSHKSAQLIVDALNAWEASQ